MKRLISVLLAVTMLLSCFTACSRRDKKSEKEAESGPVKKTTANTEGPKRGPVGVWDIPVPEINPLGSQSLYASTSYDFGEHNIKYIDNFIQSEKVVHGETWQLTVNDDSGIPLEFLKDYVKELGGTIFSSAYGDRLTFTYSKDENSFWWGDATLNDNGYMLNVIREQRVPIGKEVKFSTTDIGEDAEPMITFVAQPDGRRFISATITVPEGSLDLEIVSNSSTYSYDRSIYYERELSSIKTTRYVLDDLPQGPDALTWRFSWEPGNAPAEFTVKLEELGEIPQIKYGDELGALKVSGYTSGDVYVEPQEHVEYDSAEKLNLEGDITPEGDQIFWLPAGYWNVHLPSRSSGLDDTVTRLVPVSSGEMTVLNVPDSLSSAYSALSLRYAEPGEMTGGIEITEAKDEGTTATVSFIVNDPNDRDVFPDKNNTSIIEGGQEVEILDITRKIAPPSVVLVLDSSGSMGNLMSATIESAKKFIRGLPDGTFIKVVDFDTDVRELKGETKDAVIKSLDSVKASGATKLFDATIKGLELLEEKPRPAVVLFADGADSSIDGQGEGSYSTMEDVTEAIKEAGIPIYSIGFREGADKQAMKLFAATSGGQYYDAKDNKALDSVFEAIGNKLGNSFEIKYKRPTESALSNTPVVSLIMDASGSMDTDPAEDEGCGYRIDKTKALFHDFVMKLPDSSLMQMISFQSAIGADIITQQQITTNDKTAILQAIGSIRADGGTPILNSIRIGYENLRSVPTSKKVMVFVTDAGLEVSEEEQPEFEKLLGEIKENGINVLWAGMGVTDKEELFREAAELSGGRYIVKENADDLRSALDELLSQINKESESTRIPLSVSINEKTASGDTYSYSAITEVAFNRPAKVGKAAEPQTVTLKTGTRLITYDAALASTVTGMSLPGEETILSKRISLNARESNKAAEITVKEALLFEKFMGLDPGGMSFLTLQMDIKNVTPQKITYLIPSFKNHFYININNEGSYPASDATWLTEKPIAAPGKYEIEIPAGQTVSGVLVFVIPESPLTQFSLHFYDTVNGHVHIPLAGKMTPQLLELGSLSASEPAKITDAFSLTVKAASAMDKIQKYEAQENTTFRVIEADFDTKVQALLDIDPASRFYLKIDTGAGPLLTKMSNATALLPFGFMSPVMLAPSSPNKVRMAYPIAKSLLGTKSTIWGDVATGSVDIPVTKGNTYGKAVNKPTYSAFGIQLRVNELTTLGNVENFNEDWVVADVTFNCPPGVQGAEIPEDLFCLVRSDYAEMFEKGVQLPANGGSGSNEYGSDEESYDEESYDEESYEEESYEEESYEEESYDEESYDEESYDEESYDEESYDEEDEDAGPGSNSGGGSANLGNFTSIGSGDSVILYPDAQTNSLLYGVNGDFGIYSGSQRRGIVMFYLPEGNHKWVLKSNYFKDLNEPVASGSYSSPDLLVRNTEVEVFGYDFEAELAKAVEKAIKKYESYKSAEGAAGYVKSVNLTQADGKNYIPVPTIVTHGIVKLRSVKTPEQAVSLMKTLKWLPADVKWRYRYSPEAVLTQSWGTEWDLGYLAASLFAKCGSKVSFLGLALTSEGIAALNGLSSVNELNCSMIPGIKYTDAAGNAKVFVVPFMKDITELEGLVYITSFADEDEILPRTATITVYAKTETKADSAAAAMSDIAGVLGGGTADGMILEDVELLKKEISLPDLSRDSIEVGYTEAGPGTGSGKLYAAMISTPDGIQTGEYGVDTGKSKITGVRIDVELPDKVVSHVSTLPETDTLDRVFHNIAINLPDLPEDAAKTLEDASSKEYKAAQDPNAISALKWYGRNILNRFIATQTTYDKEIGMNMGLTLGRTSKERVLVVTSRLSRKDNKLWTSMDLVQAANQCHNGDKEKVNAYNIGSGIFLSMLEGEVIPGVNMNFQTSWAGAPAGTQLVFVPGGDFDRQIFIEPMREYGFPERLLHSVENTKNIIFVPDRPTMFGGEKRWMWLEIDPVTFETIAISDTGEHMGAGYIMNLTRAVIMGGANYMAGVFFGLETAIWSVAAYSLKYGDYENVLKAAAETTKEIGKNVSKIHAVYVDPVGTLKDVIKDETGISDLTTAKDEKTGLSAQVGEGGLDLKAPGITLNINVVDLCNMELEANISLGIVPTFSDGFNDAADFYFQLSRDGGAGGSGAGSGAGGGTGGGAGGSGNGGGASGNGN